MWASMDPGLSGSGITVFENYDDNPFAVFDVRRKNKELYMISFKEIFIETKIDFLVCENAEVMLDSEVGNICARSNKVIKLAQFIGGVEELCRSLYITIELVAPIKWKGQLPKDITKKRLQKLWPESIKLCKSSHVYDALGIGLWKQGRF